MVKTEKEHRQDIVDIGRLVYQKGWVAANDGNITIRLDQDRILATPTGVSKGMMHVDDLIIVDMQGNKIEGRKERTSEIAMHLTIYGLQQTSVRGAAHRGGDGIAGEQPLDVGAAQVIIGLGPTPLADYGLPGTPALTDSMPYIPKVRHS